MKKEKLNKGFTLLEMLVVVLIIGILAAVALPQYRIVVEKGRAAEVLTNLAAIKREIQVYVTARDLPTHNWIPYKNFATVELSGGEWSGNYYKTIFFEYGMGVNSQGGIIDIYRGEVNDGYYTLYCTQYKDGGPYNDDSPMPDGWYCSCITQFSNFGQKMCKRIYEPLGFKYVDNEL